MTVVLSLVLKQKTNNNEFDKPIAFGFRTASV